jgi:GcrA cell cycle regulator
MAKPEVRSQLTADQMLTAHKMWLGGHPVKDIAEALGIKDRRVFDLAAKRRDLFPHRAGGPRYSRRFIVEAMPADARADCMRWVTEQGATVTLPKISFIQCPRAAA